MHKDLLAFIVSESASIGPNLSAERLRDHFVACLRVAANYADAMHRKGMAISPDQGEALRIIAFVAENQTA